MTRRFAALLLAAATLLAACGGDDDTTQAPSEPTTSVDFGAQFLALAMPVNCVLVTAFDDPPASDQDWSSVADGLTATAAELSAAHLAFAEGVEAADWPANAQRAIDDVADVATSQAAVWDLASRARSATDWNEAMSELDNSAASAASIAVRLELGLPTDADVSPEDC